MPHENFISQEMRNCIDECLECFSKCSETIQHCLVMGGKHAEKNHISLLQACADICQTSARTMLGGAFVHMQVCGACADVCEKCAEDCEAMSEEFMRECAAVCRSCAESCRRMSGKTSPERERISA